MDLTTAEYVFVAVGIWITLLALWKGDAVLGLALFAVTILLYWIIVQHMRMDWLD